MHNIWLCSHQCKTFITVHRCIYYRPQTKYGARYFTGVCLSTGGGVKRGVVKGVYIKGCGEREYGRHHTPLDPEVNTPQVETAAEVGGTHPTGMHSSYVLGIDVEVYNMQSN